MPDYNEIFTAHINRVLAERRLGKSDLAEMAGVSTAFMTSLTRGEGNPTIKTMQALSEGLGIPLPLLLRPLESEEWQAIMTVSARAHGNEEALPPGFVHVEPTILPQYRAETVQQWAKTAQKKINKQLS